MLLLYSAKKELAVNRMLVDSLQQILAVCLQDQQRRTAAATVSRSPADDVNVDDSEVKVDEAQDGGASERGQSQSGAAPRTPKDGADDPCKASSGSESHLEPISSTPGERMRSEDPAVRDSGKAGSSSAGEPRVDADGNESEAEVVCLDVMEASQSIEVCTVPSAEGPGHVLPEGLGHVLPEGAGHQLASPAALKRQISRSKDGLEGKLGGFGWRTEPGIGFFSLLFSVSVSLSSSSLSLSQTLHSLSFSVFPSLISA